MACKVKAEGSAIIANTEIRAAPAIVFAALTDAEQLMKWWGSPEMYQVNTWTLNLRVGGSWRCEGKSEANGPFHVAGQFVEIDAPRTLAYTWNPSWIHVPETTVRWILEPKDYGTLLVVTHDGFSGESAALYDHLNGWPSILAWLDQHCASDTTSLPRCTDS